MNEEMRKENLKFLSRQMFWCIGHMAVMMSSLIMWQSGSETECSVAVGFVVLHSANGAKAFTMLMGTSCTMRQIRPSTILISGV